MFGKLNRNTELIIGNETFHFENMTIDKRYNFKNRLTGYPLIKTEEELKEHYCENQLFLNGPTMVIPARDFMSLDKRIRDIAWKRRDVVGAIYDAGTPKRMSKTWPEIIEAASARAGFKKAPSWQTVRLWKQSLEVSGIPGLVPGYDTRGSNVKWRSPAENAFILECIKKYFLDTHATVKSLWKTMDAAYLKKKAEEPDHTTTWKSPSENTVRRLVRKLSPYEIAFRRHGRSHAEHKFRHVKLGKVARYRLEIVEIDHTTLDTWVVDLPSGIVLGRPTLTVAIDRYSRMIVGIYIGLEPPSAFSTMQCLRNMIMPKVYIKKEFPDITISWPDAGLPTALMSDNDVSFRSETIRTFCASVNITMLKGPAWRPDYRGIVERVNRTFKESSYLDLIPGKAFQNPRQFKDYDPRKHAVITLRELREIIHEWIINEYMFADHAGIADIPLRVWEREDKDHPLRLPVSVAQLDLLTGIVETRSLSRKGIELLGLFYNSDTANIILRALNNGRSSTDVSVKVSIRVNPANLGEIALCHPETGELISVPCLSRDYAEGLTLFQHKFLRAKTRKEGRDFRDIPELKAAKIRWITKLDKILDRSSTKFRRDVIRQNAGSHITQPATDVLDADIKVAVDGHSKGKLMPESIETYGLPSTLDDELEDLPVNYSVRD